MDRSPSPPTDRVIDVVELLAGVDGGMRLAELARRLDISQSTAHAVVSALDARGWVTRDPVDRTLSLGPGLEVVAALSDTARPLARAARSAAAALSTELSSATSVTERSGDVIVLLSFGGGGAGLDALPPGERIPLRAPFGPAFVAWGTEDERRAWIGARAEGAVVAARLAASLDATRDRGLSVERMSPALLRTAQVMKELEQDPWSGPVRSIIDEALAEVAAAGLGPDGDGLDERPVTALSAPVFDRHGRVVMNLGVHPFAPLAEAEIDAIGRRLVEVARTIGAPTGA